MTDFILLEDGDNLLLEDGGNLLLESAVEVAQSTTVEFNNGTIISAKLTATFTGNDPTLYMAADGINFEEVTNETTHNFTNTGTDLRWKADGNGVTITELKIEEFH
jgi:hypothetical protein